MAYGPRHLAAVTPEEVEVLAKLEKEIDFELSRQSGSRCTVSISWLNSCGCSRSHVVRQNVLQRELTRMYKEAGWKNIKFKSEQRDGEWIEFEE